MKGMKTFSRPNLMLYQEGIMLDRNSAGVVRVCYTVEAEKAIAALENGETIYLTENDEIVSMMVNRDGRFEERALEE